MAFWDHVKKTDSCWIWTGAQTKGYGQCTIGKVNKYAHRASWELANGEIPKGMVIMHSCDIPLCVNPSHLSAGTQQDNVRDCVAKGRFRPGKRFGRDNNSAKSLPQFEPELIISLYREGKQIREIATAIGMKKSTVHNIVSGNHWSIRNGI